MVIDVVIPCHNAQDTLDRAIQSVIHQSHLGKLWLVDDASSDDTWQVIQQWQQQYPNQICAERFVQNRGAAIARNWGTLLSKAQYVGFLDADDAYQSQVLEACSMVFEQYHAAVVRLPLNGIGLPNKYLDHKDFDTAWRVFEMTGAGNMVINRSYFLALGGFDDAQVFKRFGGEDGAFGLATVSTACVATLFDNPDFQIAVDYYCHKDMHVAHLLDSLLFGKEIRGITDRDLQMAQASTNAQIANIKALKILLAEQVGKLPIKLS